jgi:hypothetical protein
MWTEREQKEPSSPTAAIHVGGGGAINASQERKCSKYILSLNEASALKKTVTDYSDTF